MRVAMRAVRTSIMPAVQQQLDGLPTCCTQEGNAGLTRLMPAAETLSPMQASPLALSSPQAPIALAHWPLPGTAAAKLPVSTPQPRPPGRQAHRQCCCKRPRPGRCPVRLAGKAYLEDSCSRPEALQAVRGSRVRGRGTLSSTARLDSGGTEGERMQCACSPMQACRCALGNQGQVGSNPLTVV